MITIETLDTTLEGLYSGFPHKTYILRKLWSQPGEWFNTRELLDGFNESRERSEDRRSRATIINACKDLYNDGVLETKPSTGKGGHRDLYRALMNPEDFKNDLLDGLMLWYRETFNNNPEWWKQ